MSFPRCGATCRDGSPCGRYPAKGQARCKLHGGGSPQAKRKAIERQAEAEIAADVATMAGGPVLDPVAWLQDVAGEIDAWLKVCRGRLTRAIDADEDNATIRLYERALGRAAEVASTMTKLGLDKAAIDQRAAQLVEEQGQVVVRIVDRVVEDVLAAAGATLPPAQINTIVVDALDAVGDQ